MYSVLINDIDLKLIILIYLFTLLLYEQILNLINCNDCCTSDNTNAYIALSLNPS